MIIRDPSQWAMFDSFLSRLKQAPIPKNGWQIEWKEAVRKRTNPQNRYYWSVVTPLVAEHLTRKHQFPYTKEMAHELLKSQFLESWDDPVTGRTFYGSTRKLTTAEWSDYMMKVQQWAALSGLDIPDPNEEAA